MTSTLPGTYYLAAAVVAALLVLGPVVAVVVVVRRTPVRLVAVGVGVLTFTVSQLLLRIPLLSVVEPLLAGWVAAHPLLWLALLSLSAGVFEETARALGFRFLLRREPSRAATPLGAGLGHGGIEAALLVGVSIASSALLFWALDTGSLPAAVLPPEAQQTLAAQRDATAGLGAGGPLAAGYERVVAMALHLALSVLVFVAVRTGRRPLVVLAVLLHGAVNFCAVATQQLLGTSSLAAVWQVELVLTVATALVVLLVWSTTRRSRALAQTDGAPR
ncbi:YhfC family glutamic-type intramembrane protease [Desertihabitans aurantiacus]|uniref:YhfC family glutamic-type intramembrane protease n=1 Tax=Desertihabitans aurantiacus TaxID=2282477 RepID=UPI000DF81F71|nr:YhfC family glutamic-type intramembrane protease [Desertihabitans aurantiacus]